MKIRYVLVGILCLLLLASFSLSAAPVIDWGGSGGGFTPGDTPSEEEPESTGELRLMADSGSARLYYNDVTTEVVFENEAGERYSSAVTSDYAGTKPGSEKNMRELFSVLVYNMDTRLTENCSALDDGMTLTL
ncbi:MAG: hypothetical protein IJZ13_06365, partial [Clostridia bacterium]|nr:hypothetical protein [Clostridia bacterium]